MKKMWVKGLIDKLNPNNKINRKYFKILFSYCNYRLINNPNLILLKKIFNLTQLPLKFFTFHFR